MPGTPGRNGCVIATIGMPATSRIAICSVTSSARRGAAARSSSRSPPGGRQRLRASATPSARAIRIAPRMNGMISASVAADQQRARDRRDRGARPRPASRSRRCRDSETAMTIAAISVTIADQQQDQPADARPGGAVLGRRAQAVHPRAVERRVRLHALRQPRGRRTPRSGRTTGSTRASAASSAPRPPPPPGRERAGSTPSDRPTPAMMNENSPIWARLMPACTDVRTP